MLWSKSKLEKTFKLKANHSKASSPEELAMLRLQGWSPSRIEEFVNVSVHGLSIVNRCTLWCTSNVRCVLWGTCSIYSQRESNLSSLWEPMGTLENELRILLACDPRIRARMRNSAARM